MLMKVRRNASALNVNDNYHFFLRKLAVGTRIGTVSSPVTMTSNGHSLEFDQAHIAALWEALKESDAYVVYLAIIAGGFSSLLKGKSLTLALRVTTYAALPARTTADSFGVQTAPSSLAVTCTFSRLP